MAKSWKTIIIEDEHLARERLKRLVAGYDFIDVIGEAENGIAGLSQIEKLRPDLIFLDIEMPGMNGFELLKRLDHPPKVIFTTAYDQYAVKAFEEESIDYLLKPVSDARLDKSMKKLQQLEPRSDYDLPLDILIKQLGVKKEVKTLTVKIGDRILLVKTADLVSIAAEDKYVFLNTLDGKRHLTEFTLTGLEEKLPDHFMRINRGMIINSELITEIRKTFNGAFSFLMNDGSKVSSSRGYGGILRERLGL